MCCYSKVANGSDTPYSSKKKKLERSPSSDFISQLPDEILCSVITHLTIKEAVRTSILSHRWEKLWCSLPIFLRDWNDMFQAHPPLYDGRDTSTGHHKTDDDSDCCKDKLIRMTDHFLDFCDRQQHGGKELKLCLYFGQEYFQAVDLWVNLALRKIGVRVVSLSSFCHNCDFCRHAKEYCCDGSISYALQMSNVELKAKYDDFPVFRGDYGCRLQKNIAKKLKTFRLTGFTLEPNFFMYNNLSCLSVLELFCVRLLSSCDAMLPTLTNLRSLILADCVLVDQLISCDLSGHSNLRGLECHVDGQGLQYMFESAPTNHPELYWLVILCRVNWVKMIPNNIATFRRVECLKLWFYNCAEFDTSKIINVLNAFPRLRRFDFHIDDFGETDQRVGCLEHIGYFPKHLHRVTINGYIGPVHVELAAFLLKRAANLRQLALCKSIFDGCRRMSWDEEERLKVLTRLRGLSEAKIRLFDPYDL